MYLSGIVSNVGTRFWNQSTGQSLHSYNRLTISKQVIKIFTVESEMPPLIILTHTV